MPIISPPPNWLNAAETAALMGVTEDWLYRARKGEWPGPPHYGFRRTIQYKEIDVLAFMEARRVTA